MRIIFLSILALIVIGIGIFPDLPVAFPKLARVLEFQPFILMGMSFLMLFEGVFSWLGDKAYKAQNNIIREAQDSIGKLQEAMKTLEAEKKQIQQENLIYAQRENQINMAKEDLEKKLAENAQSLKDAKTSDATREVVQLLSMLQQKGRFVDFLMEDITAIEDAQVGAVARVVHQGCRQVVKDYFDIVPIVSEKEGDTVTIDKSTDPGSYRLLGQVGDDMPQKGRLLHHGWLTGEVKLPEIVSQKTKQNIIAPFEVELN